ncbi:restriction endonuclease subunit S [Corynebacterium atypicum]|uniref:restriction endonuclease subunit S n=1 Tax=Corynebacterium atypicum TaxID=191610 RepID=UPI000A04DB31|nr:restriction endonuclease subunit S [Corynebacterium atypicum]
MDSYPGGSLEIPLKRLARFRSGGSIRGEEIHETGTYPVFGGNGIRGYTETSNIEGTNLLVGRQGALAGNVHFVAQPAYASEHALIASISGLVLPRYLYYLLIQMNLNQYSQAAAQPGISASVIEKVRISIPSHIEVQERMAAFLDAKTAEIDVVVEKLRRQRELLERYKRELIAHTVTKGLDPEAPMKESGLQWIGEIPEAWQIQTLSNMTDENKTKNKDLSESNLLSLSYGSIIRKDINLAFGLLSASFDTYQIVNPGYVVLRMTDLQNDKRSLRSGYVSERGIITGAYIGLIPGAQIDPRFLGWMMRAYDLKKIFYGLGSGVRQSLNYSELRKLPTLLPPLREQEEIADFLDSKTAEIDGLIGDIDRQMELLGAYRKQVINDVVTGKVRVSEEAA